MALIELIQNNPRISIIILSFVVTLFITIVNFFMIDREKMKEILQNSEFGIKDYFYRTAQAISETLPSQSAEKKLLEGFLSGKERLIKEVKVKSVQKRLFE